MVTEREEVGQRKASSHPEKIGKQRQASISPSVQPLLRSPIIYPSGQELNVVT